MQTFITLFFFCIVAVIIICFFLLGIEIDYGYATEFIFSFLRIFIRFLLLFIGIEKKIKIESLWSENYMIRKLCRFSFRL